MNNFFFYIFTDNEDKMVTLGSDMEFNYARDNDEQDPFTVHVVGKYDYGYLD